MPEPILSVKNLAVEYPDGTKALRGITFNVAEREILGVVGESGSGKSTLVMAIINLLPQGSSVSGKILYKGRDILAMSKRELEEVRGEKIAVVFQDAQSAFDPLMKVGKQIVEKPVSKGSLGFEEARSEALKLMFRLGITHPEAKFESYPHELSGGLKQRAFFAMAMFQKPELLILDEPTTALDVITQAQLVALIRELREMGLAIIFVTHDIILASILCDRLMVLYAGRMMEYGETRTVVTKPFHPYTLGLIESTPSLSRSKHDLKPLDGYPPNPRSLPSGCKFHPRCPKAWDLCRKTEPEYTLTPDGRIVSCHLNGEGEK